jgi:hypothetical protein
MQEAQLANRNTACIAHHDCDTAIAYGLFAGDHRICS